MSEHFEGDLELADSHTMGFYKQSWTHLPRGKKKANSRTRKQCKSHGGKVTV